MFDPAFMDVLSVVFGILVVRDVLTTRRALSRPVSLVWLLIALLWPLGTIAWIGYRRRSVKAEELANSLERAASLEPGRAGASW